MSPSFSARMVRELKGAPLACYLLILMAGQPVTNEWLCQFSGYTDKPISQALKLLSSPEYQLIRRAGGGWMLNAAQQLVLGEMDPESAENSDTNYQSRNFSDSGGGIKLIKLIKLINQLSDSKTLPPGRNFSDSRYSENFKACKKAGIFDSVAEQLSSLEHVSPEFILGHAASLRPGEGRGLAVFRIRENAPLPADPKDGEQNQNRYSNSEFFEDV